MANIYQVLYQPKTYIFVVQLVWKTYSIKKVSKLKFHKKFINVSK